MHTHRVWRRPRSEVARPSELLPLLLAVTRHGSSVLVCSCREEKVRFLFDARSIIASLELDHFNTLESFLFIYNSFSSRNRRAWLSFRSRVA
jgi:hypothetical protein